MGCIGYCATKERKNASIKSKEMVFLFMEGIVTPEYVFAPGE